MPKSFRTVTHSSGRASLAALYLTAPEVTRRDTRVHFLKERIVPEVGYGLSLEGASAADLVPTVNLTPETEVCLKSVKSARRG